MSEEYTTCPYCGSPVMKNDITRIENKRKGYWVGRFYHMDCYTLAIKTPKDAWPAYVEKRATDIGARQVYAEMIYDYMRQEQKIAADFALITKQMTAFKAKRVSSHGRKIEYNEIFLAIVYFYEIKSQDPAEASQRSRGGIGIVPYVYDESVVYWAAQKEMREGLLNGYKAQIKKIREYSRPTTEKKPAYKDKFKPTSFDDIL